MIIKNIVSRIKRKFFPSQYQLMVRKWWADGGDYALRFNYNLGEDSVVFDLGGYEGQWASDLFARYKCRIYIFEPVTSFANRISERFSKNDKLKVFPYGLGGTSRADKIHISADGSSVFGKSKNKEKINIVDVKEWIDSNMESYQHIDLMKINIEGGEYELLDRLIETHLITNIENIQVQFHQVLPNSLLHMEKIQADLMKTHKPTYQYKFVWENWKKKSTG